MSEHAGSASPSPASALPAALFPVWPNLPGPVLAAWWARGAAGGDRPA